MRGKNRKKVGIRQVGFLGACPYARAVFREGTVAVPVRRCGRSPGRDRVVFRCASERYREWGHDCFRMEFRHRCRCLRHRALGRGRSVSADRTVSDAMGRRGCPASLTGGRSGCGSGADRAEAGDPARPRGAGRLSGRALCLWGPYSEMVVGAGPASRDDRRTRVGRERPEKVGEREADGRGRVFRAKMGRPGGAERRFHLPMYRRFELLWPAAAAVSGCGFRARIGPASAGV